MLEEVDKLYDLSFGFLHANYIFKSCFNHFLYPITFLSLHRANTSSSFTLSFSADLHDGFDEEVKKN
jgi:hypothetical protein